MEAFTQLRKVAAGRRDKAMAAAQDEYRKAMFRIGELERQICGKRTREHPKPRKPLKELMLELMPRDCAFTLPELIKLLQAEDKGRHVHAPTARSFLYRWEREGIVRRIGRDQSTMVWAHRSYQATEKPFGIDPLSTIVQDILAGAGQLSVADIVVALRERGCRVEDSAADLTKSVRRMLNKNPRRFQEDDGRWSLGQ
jgi:hypothetical protein